MKRVFNILSIIACTAALLSCSHKASFTTGSYVTIDVPSLTVKEDVGIIRIPVSSFNADGVSGEVYFNVNNGTAVQGTDFTVEPASGVIHFDGNGTKFIEIAVIEHAGVLTGPLAFSVELTKVSGTLEGIGGAYYTDIVIQDNDVVVNWDYVIGDWTANDFDGGAPDGDAYKVTIEQKGDTKLSLFNLYGGGEKITGTIEFDEVNNTAVITFEPNQLVWNSSNYGPTYLLGYNFERDGWYSNTPAVADVTSGGIAFRKYTLLMSGAYEGYIWTSAGLTTILSK